MAHRISRFLSVAVVLLLTAPVTTASAAKLGAAKALEQAQLAAHYMAAAETAEGAFPYEYDFAAGALTSGDNVVRQAGAGFALAQYLQATGDTSVKQRIVSALGYYRALSVAHGDGELLTGSGKEEDGNPGATALALLTELYYFEATGDTAFAADRQLWLRGLATLQLAEGGFRTRSVSKKQSSFYDGEAWLALAQYQVLFPDDAVAAAMLKTAEPHMIALYGTLPDIGFAHWGLLAAALRYGVTHDKRYLGFITTLARAHLTVLAPKMSRNANACSAVEGFSAAAVALIDGKAESDLVKALIKRSGAELKKSISMQIQPGQKQIPRDDKLTLDDPKIADFAGAFLNGRYTMKTRIDFTQHCLSALLDYAAVAKVIGRK
jgi:hypothetical protein